MNISWHQFIVSFVPPRHCNVGIVGTYSTSYCPIISNLDVESSGVLGFGFWRFITAWEFELCSSESGWCGIEVYFCCWPFALIKNVFAHRDQWYIFHLVSLILCILLITKDKSKDCDMEFPETERKKIHDKLFFLQHVTSPSSYQLSCSSKLLDHPSQPGREEESHRSQNTHQYKHPEEYPVNDHRHVLPVLLHLAERTKKKPQRDISNFTPQHFSV